MRMRVSARLQATAAPEAPEPMISTSTMSSAMFVSAPLGPVRARRAQAPEASVPVRDLRCEISIQLPSGSRTNEM